MSDEKIGIIFWLVVCFYFGLKYFLSRKGMHMGIFPPHISVREEGFRHEGKGAIIVISLNYEIQKG